MFIYLSTPLIVGARHGARFPTTPLLLVRLLLVLSMVADSAVTRDLLSLLGSFFALGMGHVLAPPVPRLAMEDTYQAALAVLPLEDLPAVWSTRLMGLLVASLKATVYPLPPLVSVPDRSSFTLLPPPKLSWVGSGLQTMHSFFFLAVHNSLGRFPVSTDHRRLLRL